MSFTLTDLLGPVDSHAALRADAAAGLGAHPYTLPARWFYDERGSDLFDQITRLPEYYPTRTERSILAARATDIADATGADTLVELGSGTSEKTRLLLASLTDAGTLRRFIPVDVDPWVLGAAGKMLIDEHPEIDVAAVVADFTTGLADLPRGGRRMVAFLGSTIGNLDPAARAGFLTSLAATLDSGDSFLLGTDLVKPPERLLAAYDDGAGVTAAFNRNLLTVLNRELGGDFDPDGFVHRAHWDPDQERIEMRLESLRDQVVSLPRAELTVPFCAGEHIRTEISTKFRRAGVERELVAAGLRLEQWWTDPDGDFALSLSTPA